MITFPTAHELQSTLSKFTDRKHLLKVQNVAFCAIETYAACFINQVGEREFLLDMTISCLTALLNDQSHSYYRGSALIGLAFRVDLLRGEFLNQQGISAYHFFSFANHLFSLKYLAESFLEK